MNAKDTLDKVKTLLGLEVQLEERLLENGTRFEADAFESGREVFIISEDDERIAVPAGEYLLDDGMILIVEEDGVIAEADFQKFTLAKNRSEEELKSANDNLELIKEGVIKSAGTASNTLIKSTVNGMVLNVPVKEGNSVIESNTFNAGTTISVVADMSSMVFEGKIDESEVGKLKIGMALVLSVGAIENQKFDAKLEYIAPKGIEEAGAIQFEIKADVTLKDSTFIRAGYSANGDIVLGKREDVLAIREGLLQFASDSVYVEIETGEQEFDKVIVETGLSDGINIEILSGIDSNTLIKGAIIVDGELVSESTEKTKKKFRKKKH